MKVLFFTHLISDKAFVKKFLMRCFMLSKKPFWTLSYCPMNTEKVDIV